MARGLLLCKPRPLTSPETTSLLEPISEPENEQPADATASRANANAEKSTFGLPPSFLPDGLPGALFGYSRYPTEKRLAELGQLYQELWQEDAEIIRDLEIEVDRHRERERIVGETILAARQEATKVTENARRTAEALLKEAREQADRIQEDAERAATATAKELIETAEGERASLLEEAGRARAFIDETHDQLSDFLLAAVKWYETAKLSRDGKPETSGERAGEELAQLVEGPELDSLGLNGSPDAGVAEHP
jgi:cell division septum initiation protein DivIVA